MAQSSIDLWIYFRHYRLLNYAGCYWLIDLVLPLFLPLPLCLSLSLPLFFNKHTHSLSLWHSLSLPLTHSFSLSFSFLKHTTHTHSPTHFFSLSFSFLNTNSLFPSLSYCHPSAKYQFRHILFSLPDVLCACDVKFSWKYFF